MGELYSLDPASFVLRDLFFVKYEVANGGQRELALHRDGSRWSFNVLLNPYEGPLRTVTGRKF